MSTQRRRVLANSDADSVYIEGLDGKAYTVDNWQSSYGANSIIVASGDVKFRMALKQELNYLRGIGHGDENLKKYMTAITGETEAKEDYDGAGNTAKILKLQSDAIYAAGVCNKFTFPDGKTKGYLPSFGQLWLTYQNKDKIEAALRKCGGTVMTESYWSSTYWGVNNGGWSSCWMLYWSDGRVSHASLSFGNYVRPFADLT